MAVWFSLRSFGVIFPIWYVWTKKNLATLARGQFFNYAPRCEIWLQQWTLSLGVMLFPRGEDPLFALLNSRECLSLKSVNKGVYISPRGQSSPLPREPSSTLGQTHVVKNWPLGHKNLWFDILRMKGTPNNNCASIYSATFFSEFQISELQISDRHFTKFWTKTIFLKRQMFEWPKVWHDISSNFMFSKRQIVDQ
jgi:hypothetical protein